MLVQVYHKPPKDFSPSMKASACYIDIEGKMLFLAQGPKKSETGSWGVPAGKIEPGETPLEAACRELLEETGISINPLTQAQSLGCIYMRNPEMDYIYHLFNILLDEVPSVQISHEHQDYLWATRAHLAHLPFMTGAKESLEQYNQLMKNVKR